MLDDFAQEGNIRLRDACVLQSLRFQAMTERHASVVEAHPGTFQWIYQGSERSESPQVNFVDWLLSGEDCYWVTGKAGSGKSTLMKYILEGNRTHELLRQWAGQDRLVVANFFFWDAGTQMQKCQIGLLRSLLHEIFNQCPSLIAQICPSRWQDASAQHGKAETMWTIGELLQAIDAVGRTQNTALKMCIFIDGLDEYDGDPMAMVQMAKALSSTRGVKLCVSSRPWNEFAEGFGERNQWKLMLQDFTKVDIRRYVNENLVGNARFSRLQAPDSRRVKFVEEVIYPAKGVFLWVKLVVRSLNRGLTNCDNVSDLEARLRQIPPDLELFFLHILDSIDEFYRGEASMLFQIATVATQPLLAMTMSNLEMEKRNSNYALEAEVKVMKEEEIYAAQNVVQRRMNARCKDLLEINENVDENAFFRFKVEFLHRTVKDFLRTDRIHRKLSSWSSSDFHAELSLCRALLTQLKSLPMPELSTEHLFMFVEEFMYHARASGIRAESSFHAIIDQVELVIAQQLKGSEEMRGSKNHWTNLFDDGRSERYNEYGQKDFLSYAIEEPVRSYVKDKLESQPGLIKTKRGRPLLDYALRPTPLARITRFKSHDSVDYDTVNLLLERGADPNQEVRVYGDVTVWALFLQEMFALKSENKSVSFDQMEIWFQVSAILVKHGASPDLYMGRDRLNVATILEYIFSPRHRVELQALLEKNRASTFWKWIGWKGKYVDWPDEPEVATKEKAHESRGDYSMAPIVVTRAAIAPSESL